MTPRAGPELPERSTPQLHPLHQLHQLHQLPTLLPLVDLDRPITDRYTRADAIADHLLIEVDPRQATAFGFRCPVAVAAAAWTAAIAPPDHAHHHRPHVVDIIARLTDVLWQARTHLDAHPHAAAVPFTVLAEHERAAPVNLAARRDVGDLGEDVITIVPATDGHLLLHEERWPVVRLAGPVVTDTVLHAILAAAILAERITFLAAPTDGTVTIAIPGRRGRTVTLRPALDGSYHLGSLGWRWER